jgi:hypothetical protein
MSAGPRDEIPRFFTRVAGTRPVVNSCLTLIDQFVTVQKCHEVATMPISPLRTERFAPNTASFGRIFWSRRSMFVLMMSALGLWAVPIAIGYGLTRLF